MRVVARAAVDAPLPGLAAMLDAPPAELRQRLGARGLRVPAETSSRREIALANGGQTRPAMEALNE